ncbi:MAG: hypothetical protein RLZZ70_378 [Candidatus Parcubacteria bacterium]
MMTFARAFGPRFLSPRAKEAHIIVLIGEYPTTITYV